MILEARHKTAQLAADVIGRRVIERAIVELAKLIGLQSRCMHPARGTIESDCAVVSLPAGFGHDLNHTTGGLSILRFKPAGLYLDFLNEGKVDTASYRSLIAGKHTQPTEGRVSNIHAICNIKIFQTRTAGDGGV